MPKEISPAKRRRALVLYVQGLPFVEIATKTGLSTGSVANIVQEAKEGKFEEVRDVREQIDGLRELSVALRKGKLEIAQAFLGLSFYERLVKLGIGPDALDSWAKMCHEISPPDYAVEEFVNAALRLKELERLKGMAYEELVEDYETKSEALNEVESKTNELETTRQALSEEIHNLSDEKRTLKAEVRGLSTERSLISGRLKKWKEEEEDLKAEVAEIQKRLGGLKRESKRLESRTVALREEVDQKEGILSSLKSLGFGEGELLRLKNKLEELAADGNIKPAELREDLFLDLDSYTSVLGFRNEAAKLRAEVKTLREEKEGLTEANENLRQAVKELQKVSDQARMNIKKKEAEIVDSMGKLFNEAGKALDQSVSGAKSRVNELQGDIQSARQQVKNELGTVVSEAVDYGRAMARMEKVEGEREELVRLFGILGDVSSVPKDMAVKAPLVVLGKFRQWVERNHGLRNEKKLLSSVEEIVGLLTMEAT